MGKEKHSKWLKTEYDERKWNLGFSQESKFKDKGKLHRKLAAWISKRYLHTHVHGSIIHSTQNVEAT